MAYFYILLSHCFPGASEHYLIVGCCPPLRTGFLVFLRLFLYRSFLHSVFLSLFLPKTHYFLRVSIYNDGIDHLCVCSRRIINLRNNAAAALVSNFSLPFVKRVSEHVALATVSNGGSSVLGLLTVTRPVSLHTCQGTRKEPRVTTQSPCGDNIADRGSNKLRSAREEALDDLH